MLSLANLKKLAVRYVPSIAADARMHENARSWWPAHELGHFLVASADECLRDRFGLEYFDEVPISNKHAIASWRHALASEVAAMSISQRLLRRAGHIKLADEEIKYTDETTIDSSFELWCQRATRRLLAFHHVTRLPTTYAGLERMLVRKTRYVARWAWT